MYLYKLSNNVNGKSYIGITIRPVKKRLADHLGVAKRGRTTLIARALRKYGLDAFTLTVLAEASTYEELCEMERVAIQEYDTFNPHGYNLTLGGEGTLGRLQTDEAKAAISAKNKGKIHDQAFRDAVSARMKGVPKSPEQRAKMGEWQRGEHNSQFGKKPAHHDKMLAAVAAKREADPTWGKGRQMSEEHRAKLLEANTGRKMSEENRAKVSAVHRGKVVSAETRAKLSAATQRQFASQGNPMQGRTHSAETRALMSAQRKGKPLSEEHRARMRGRTLSPEQRATMSQQRKGKHRGEDNPTSKLTADDVRTIRQRYASGHISCATLAKAFGVTEMTISNIVRRKSWTHIEE